MLVAPTWLNNHRLNNRSTIEDGAFAARAPNRDPDPPSRVGAALVESGEITRRAEALIECQKSVLERIVAGSPLEETLEILTSSLEANARRKTIATIMLASPDKTHLYPIAGNSAPAEWREYIARVPIAANAGSCGSAAHGRVRIIASDIATDPHWIDFKDVALRLGLRACWSTPIANADEPVLGTFALYYPQPSTPSPDEMEMVEIMTRTAAVAIQKAVLFRALHRELESQKQAEINSRRLAAIVEGSDDAIIGKDLNGIIQSWNRGAERIFGYTASEVVGKSITMLIPEDRLHEESEFLSNLRAGRRIDHFETFRLRKDGQLINLAVTVSPIRNSEGVVIGASKIARDITADRDAQVMRNRLAAIVESSDDAIIGLNLDTTITAWNRGAERTFGYTASEVVGQSVTILIPPGLEDEEPRLIARLSLGERVEHYETVRRRKDGTLVNVSLTVSPIYNAFGKIVGASKISRDITEAKRQEESLRRQQEQMRGILAERNEWLEAQVAERTAALKETIQELEAFSYSVSHDMRSPLRAMHGYAEALVKDYGDKLDPTAVNYLSRIQRAAKRMDLLIQDVLAYSRVAKGDIDLSPVNVESVIADVIQHYPALHPDRAQIIVEGPIPQVIGHEAYVTQIVSNFLGNAVKFMNPGVTPKVVIASREEGGMLRIGFKDNGIGIEADQQKHIFQIFGRVYPDKKYEGTGIGLAIAKKAAERMGGSVGLESQFGVGSEFFVTLRKA